MKQVKETEEIIPSIICESEIKKNIVNVDLGKPLTRPLRELNTNCEFREHYLNAMKRMYGSYEKRYEKEKHNARMREYYKEWYQRPEVKERRREYHREWYQRPEVKEKVREYKREYYQRPEVKERRRKQQREYYQRKKIKEKERGYYQTPEYINIKKSLRRLRKLLR